MKCDRCEAKMTAVKVPYRYAESGLPNVILMGIEVFKCPQCGTVAARIPDMKGLHNAIARCVAKLDRRLVPAELGFLDKFVGYNATDEKLLHLRDEIAGWPKSTAQARRRVELFLRLITLIALDDEPDALRALKDDIVFALAQDAEAGEAPESPAEQPPEQRFLRSKDQWAPRALLAG